MALSLICVCGARFELEETLAGQEVSCPECQQPIKAPAGTGAPGRTSGYALASTILALVGAFTVLGTVAAVILGLIGLGQITRHRDRVTGVGFALFGVIGGALLTALTLFALSANDVLGFGGWFRERTMSENVDRSGPLEVVQQGRGFAITRPTEKWGRVSGDHTDDPVLSALQQPRRDLLLMQVARYAFVDVRCESWDRPPADCEGDVLAELEGPPPAPVPFNNRRNPWDDDDEDEPRPRVRAVLQRSRALPAEGNLQKHEMLVDVRAHGQRWRFLIRIYRQGNGPVYVVRAYTQKHRFPPAEEELRRALDSFRVLSR
jgi:hypothetical protein